LNLSDCYRILGLTAPATEKQIKAAYRKLALRYHPDRNTAPRAAQKFEEATEAYNQLLEHQEHADVRVSEEEDRWADEMIRRERESLKRQARARREKIRQQDEYFNRPEWHDPLLAIRYLFRVLAIILAAAAVLLPILYAILVEPASLAGTIFFMIVGIILSIYIYQHRREWLRLGKFRTGREDLKRFFRPVRDAKIRERCCYTADSPADGKPYRIELVKTVGIKIRSFGALDHAAGYDNRVRRVVVPRSVRAQQFHRFSTLIKLLSISAFLIFFPVDSLLWRFLAGLLAALLLSSVMLKVAGVRSKVGYLCTPGLLIKTGIWVGALLLVSRAGPGFNIHTTGHIYIVVAGLLFLLDMVFDLVMGFFPFYRKLFRPLFKQGVILDSQYRDGYQNYMELPVYSMIYPLFRWIF